jgi:DEAD/DEAH box helicase domain-containing protein
VSDNLDNGAGYSSGYSSAREFGRLLESAMDTLGDFFQERSHADSCTTSCHHCLRHYGNRSNHQALDWRLGLDMIEILLGRREVFALTAPWWERYTLDLLHRRLEQITNASWRAVRTRRGLCFISSHGRGLLPVHPLTNVEHRILQGELDEVRVETGNSTIGYLNVFDFERGPITALQRSIAAR